MISRTIAATPRATGTKITSQVGLPTQFDYTSQKSVPKKDLQQPPRQKLGSLQLVVSTMSLFLSNFNVLFLAVTLNKKCRNREIN